MVDVVPERTVNYLRLYSHRPCFLPHLFWDRTLASNNKNARSKRLNE